MRVAAIGLVALLVLAPPVAAQARILDVSGRDDGYDFWMEFSGLPGRNPTVNVTPGERVTVRFTNHGTSAHNFHVAGPVERETPCCQQPGASASLTFDAPASGGDLAYYCVPHRSLGMEGAFRLVGVAAPGSARGAPAPGEAALFAALSAAAALALRRSPKR